MRHTLLLVAALALTVAATPMAVAQEQETPVIPASSEPAALPGTYTQPVMPAQFASPYAPAYSSGVMPCGGSMPAYGAPTYGTPAYGSFGSVAYGGESYSPYQTFASPYQSGAVQYGSMPQAIAPAPLTYSYGQPAAPYGAIPSSFPLSPMNPSYGQPLVQYGQPALGAVAGGVITQPELTLSGMNTYSGMTYAQPIPNGSVMMTGGMPVYPGQGVIQAGYTGFEPAVIQTDNRSGRRGLFGRRR